MKYLALMIGFAFFNVHATGQVSAAGEDQGAYSVSLVGPDQESTDRTICSGSGDKVYTQKSSAKTSRKSATQQ